MCAHECEPNLFQRPACPAALITPELHERFQARSDRTGVRATSHAQDRETAAPAGDVQLRLQPHHRTVAGNSVTRSTPPPPAQSVPARLRPLWTRIAMYRSNQCELQGQKCL